MTADTAPNDDPTVGTTRPTKPVATIIPCTNGAPTVEPNQRVKLITQATVQRVYPGIAALLRNQPLGVLDEQARKTTATMLATSPTSPLHGKPETAKQVVAAFTPVLGPATKRTRL